MPDRLGQISQGAKDATAYDFFRRLGDKVKGLFPEGEERPVQAREGYGGDLAEEIAGVSRMVQSPESTSTDWTSMGTDFMETGDLEDASDDELMMILDQLLGQEGGDRESMIEDLTRYRDRMYTR